MTSRRITIVATELLGPYGQMALGESKGFDGGYWSRRALASRLYTIAGGTSEVMRNIVGDRVLPFTDHAAVAAALEEKVA